MLETERETIFIVIAVGYPKHAMTYSQRQEEKRSFSESFWGGFLQKAAVLKGDASRAVLYILNPQRQKIGESYDPPIIYIRYNLISEELRG